jgi:hypothetical protein
MKKQKERDLMTSKNKIEIIIQGLPPSPNKFRTMHWGHRSRESKKWRQMTAYLALRYSPKDPFKGVWLTFKRHSSQPMDPDNGCGSVKALIDGLVDAKIIADDGPDIVLGVKHEWEIAPPGKGFIKIIIESADHVA